MPCLAHALYSLVYHKVWNMTVLIKLQNLYFYQIKFHPVLTQALNEHEKVKKKLIFSKTQSTKPSNKSVKKEQQLFLIYFEI